MRVLARIAGYSALIAACLLFWAALITVFFVPPQTTATLVGLVVLVVGAAIALADWTKQGDSEAGGGVD